MVIASRPFYGHGVRMSENERVHFKIAIPVELKKKLEHIAVDNRRSLSAEIIRRLEESLLVESLSDDDYVPTENIHPDTSSEDLVALLSQALEIARRGV